MSDTKNSESPPSRRVVPGIQGYFIETPLRGDVQGATFTRMWQQCRAHWLWLLLAMIIGGAVGILAFVKTTPVYRASVTIAPAEDVEGGSGLGALDQLGGIASLAGVPLDAKVDKTQLAMAYLTSDALTREFIIDNNLMPVLFSKSWDSKSQKWTSEEPPTMNQAIVSLDQGVRKIARVPTTGLY
ncbi:MAG: hypothetical protein HKN70_15070, partial [Gammaproteobacteria bacterium]|nr:hypothetical protein [Gammaproteobacteria bacterium]